MDSARLQAAVASNVRTAIEQSGRSTLSVAEQTGIPRATLMRRLSGHSPLTVVELGSLANLLGVEPADLMRVPTAEPVSA